MCVHQINVSYRIHAKYANSEADGRFTGNILVAVAVPIDVAIVAVVVAVAVDQAQTIIVVLK